MYLVLVTALVAACNADKLDRTYLPPPSANSAGGSHETLQTPFRSFNQGLGGLPKGGYSNNFEGIVVDAAAPGTRASGSNETGLGAARISYGSTDSKVGEAAFTSNSFSRVGAHSGLNITPGKVVSGQPAAGSPERIQASRDRASNTVKYENDVSHDSFNYAFETDNGIVAEENGVEVNGVKAQGGYSYTGDDGQVYSVTYTADEGGYRPRGDHLPTPPPIPAEILKSLEQNAKDEASGVVDDGSYDAQKYNTGEDYTKSDSANGKYDSKQPSRLENIQADPEASGSFVTQNNQAQFGRPNPNQLGSNSFATSSNVPSNFEATNNANAGQNGQKFILGSGSNEYLPPSGIFNQDRPDLNSNAQNIRSNQASRFPLSSLSSSAVNINAGLNKDQNSQTQSFVPLSQQKLQEDKPKRPIFGKPTVIDSTLSIKDPFANRPFGNRFSQNKPNLKPQVPTGGSFEVVSGNVYSSKKEYLPPRNQFNKLNQKGNDGFKAGSGSPNSPSVTAFATVSRPSVGFQSFQNQGEKNPLTFNGLNSQTSKQQQIDINNPTIPNYNRASFSQSQYKPSFASQSPTLQPQTELTTPLESNSNNAAASVPIINGPDSSNHYSMPRFPSLDVQQSNNFPGQSNFNTQKVSPTQASAYAFASIIGQSAPGLRKPEFGASALSGVFPNTSPIDVQYSSSTLKPTFSINNQQQGPDDSYHYNKPSTPFNVPSIHGQHSRYPSSSFDQPFKVPETLFGTIAPLSDDSSITLQSNKPVGSSSYSTLQPVSPTLPSYPTNQNSNTFQSFNRVTQASASSFPTIVPTGTTNLNSNQFISQQQQSAFNKPGSSLVQATASVSKEGDSQRVGLVPGSSQYQQTQQYSGEIYEYKKPPQMLPVPQKDAFAGQIGQNSQIGLPTSEASQFNSASKKPNSEFDNKFNQQATSAVGQTSQNYQVPQGSFNANFNSQQSQFQFGSHQNQDSHGAQVDVFNSNSPSQTNRRPGQFGSILAKPTQLESQNNEASSNGQIQSQSPTNSKPGQFDASSKPSQSSQAKQESQGFNSNTQEQSRPSSVNFESFPKQTQHARPVQGASKFPPTYSGEGPSCCKPNVASQSSQRESQPSQFSGQFRPNDEQNTPQFSVSSFASVGESFDGPRKPPSFDESGYHY